MGRFVTIDDRVVFIGGPGQGAGSASGASASSNQTRESKIKIEECAEILDKLSSRFGIPVGKAIASDKYGEVARVVGHDVYFNMDLLNHPTTYDSDYGENFALPSNQTEVVIHEFGHLIEGELTFNPQYGKYGLGGTAAMRNAAGISWEQSLTRRIEDIAHNQGLKISQYATKNGEEYFAECFVAYIRGGNIVNNIHPDVLRIFNDLDSL